jgi:predicted transposase YbfD/YdcC
VATLTALLGPFSGMADSVMSPAFCVGAWFTYSLAVIRALLPPSLVLGVPSHAWASSVVAPETLPLFGVKLGLKQVAIDGKTLRGSADQAKGLRALHLVSAWSTANHRSLAQVAVDTKSNEIIAIPELLRLLELKGALVSIDAMGCQKTIARQIVEQGGDYILPVKGNQGRLKDDIAATMNELIERDLEGIEHDGNYTEERGHGRLERRSYMVVYDLHLIRDRALWSKLSAVGMCIYEREIKDQVSNEEHYFIGSRRASAKEFAQSLRAHWGIENNLHWQLDVCFAEDNNQVTNRIAAQNLAVLRRLALSLLKRYPAKDSMNTKRYNASLNTDCLEAILMG